MNDNRTYDLSDNLNGNKTNTFYDLIKNIKIDKQLYGDNTNIENAGETILDQQSEIQRLRIEIYDLRQETKNLKLKLEKEKSKKFKFINI